MSVYNFSVQSFESMDKFYHEVDCSRMSALPWFSCMPKGFVLLPTL